jgi:hypothetical protein
MLRVMLGDAVGAREGPAAIDSQKLAEGLSAFFEKRAPRWRRGST